MLSEVFKSILPHIEPTSADDKVLKVLITGGGPVALTFALELDELLGSKAFITICDGRWTESHGQMQWKTGEHGNARRQQVVTIQSRQFLQLPAEAQERIFSEGKYSVMWPAGPDSVNNIPPRNVRIAHFESRLLELVDEKRDRIRLLPIHYEVDDPKISLNDYHVLAICEGAQSRTREYFENKFGAGDKSMYSVNDEQVQDVVLGLRVVSELPDPMSVMLTVAQNRFLLNTLHGEGFLYMRLSDEEAEEVTGIDVQHKIFSECIQSRPCLMERSEHGEFTCGTHGTLFLPALRGDASQLWSQIEEGLKLFGVREENLSAVTAFRLSMVHRARFSALVRPPVNEHHGTYAFLLGDAANAIHFWPGRGLNAGMASAFSLARCLAARWNGAHLRDADFTRHEANMAMLQYRHKSRAWRAMVVVDDTGTEVPIKAKIAAALDGDHRGTTDEKSELVDTLMKRLDLVQRRLGKRIGKLPSLKVLEGHVDKLSVSTLRVLVESGPWDTMATGGEEVDIDWLLRPE